MTTRLTLTVSAESIAKGKAYAARHHTRISQMVETLLLSLQNDEPHGHTSRPGGLTTRLLGLGCTATGGANHIDDKALLAEALMEKFR